MADPVKEGELNRGHLHHKDNWTFFISDLDNKHTNEQRHLSVKRH